MSDVREHTIWRARVRSISVTIGRLIGMLSGQYQLLVSRDGLLDQVEVHCELQPSAAGMTPQQQQEIAGWVKQRVKTLVGITTSVSVLAPDSIERTLTGKARRVVDKRPK